MHDGVSLFKRIKDVEAHENVPLSRYTTWKVGGPAKFMAFVGRRESLLELLAVAVENGLDCFVLGNGSNILVSDAGIDGLCIRLRDELASVHIEGGEVTAGGGALLSSIVTEAAGSGLSGMEFTFGIPGTIGGAVMTNAGAFSRSIAEVLREVRSVTLGGVERVHEGFVDDYRTNLIPKGEIVTDVTVSLSHDSTDEIRKRMGNYRKHRRSNQPWGMSTAGSVFKNPPGDSAGRLIEECGLKGVSIGGARISEIHANFIINDGGANAADIFSLIELTRKEVKTRFGLEMELEVELVGAGWE